MRLVDLVDCLYVLGVHLLAETLSELFKLGHDVFLLALQCFDASLQRVPVLFSLGALELEIETLGLQVLPGRPLLLAFLHLVLDPFLEKLFVARQALTDSAQLIDLAFHLLERHRLDLGVLLALLQLGSQESVLLLFELQICLPLLQANSISDLVLVDFFLELFDPVLEQRNLLASIDEAVNLWLSVASACHRRLGLF